MKITAALCWYAETTETLSRCVRSLAGYCDSLIAYGGRWEGFPQVPNDNPQDQLDTVVSTASEFGLDGWAWCPDNIWSSQVEKRAVLMEHACLLGDWILVIDADEHIADGTPEDFRGHLLNTEHDVARVFAYRIPIPYGRHIHRVYRTNTGVTVKQAHNGYVTREGKYLNGDPTRVTLEPWAVVPKEAIQIAHDLEVRGQVRKNARKAYNMFRRQHRLEAWL